MPTADLCTEDEIPELVYTFHDSVRDAGYGCQMSRADSLPRAL